MMHVSVDGIINIHSKHQWAEKNSHGVIHSRHQQQFSINVYTRTVGDCSVRPHVSPHRFTGNHYPGSLLNDLPKLLENVPLAFREGMWYIHDGAPAPFSRRARCSQ
jgi:hypothetical protein